MTNFLKTSLLSAVIVTTLSQANASQLVPLGFDFDADDARKASTALVVYQAPEAQTEEASSENSTSWWSKATSAAYNFGTDLVGLVTPKPSTQIVPVDFDFEKDDAKKATAAKEKATSAWSAVANGGYTLGSGLIDLGYGVVNTGYTLGMTAKGLGEMAFGASEVVYGAAHNAYGTFYEKDEEFFKNGKSWQEAGFKNVSYGFGDVKDGVMNIPNTATHFINALPKVVSGGVELYSGVSEYLAD